jgi:hypothetical protein
MAQAACPKEAHPVQQGHALLLLSHHRGCHLSQPVASRRATVGDVSGELAADERSTSKIGFQTGITFYYNLTFFLVTSSH